MTLIRTSAAAIAAATVLSPGLALAQEVDPSTTVAAPVDTATPVTTPEAVTVEPTASDPLSPATDTPEASASETAPAATTRSSMRTSSARTAPRAVSTNSAPSPAAATPTPVVDDGPVTNPLAQTVEPLAVEEAAPVPAPVDVSNDDIVPIAAGAGAGLLALLGLSMAMRRRKVTKDDMVVSNEPRIAQTVVDEPASVTTTPTAYPRPAFAFGNHSPAAAAVAPIAASGGNRIERALRGPTPDNPFLSLKKRLKRAAFFEQRERQVREGVGTRVSPMAGLPERLVDHLAPRREPRFQPA